ncbi:MAG: DUF222 domain-containing protein [Microthrixaceae bacterium]
MFDLDEDLGARTRQRLVVDDVDVEVASDLELMDAALQLERTRRELDAASVKVLAELDARGATDLHDGMRTPRWLAHHAELPASVASARVGVARTLRNALPEIGQDLAQGHIGFEHAKVLADACNPRIAADFPAAAAYLATQVERTVFEVWKRQVHNVANELDQDGAHDPADDIARNRLTKGDTIDHTYVLRATHVGPDGLVVHQAINTVADELFQQFLRDEALSPVELRAPSRPTVEALALVEICRRAMGIDLESSKGPVADITVVINAGEPEAVHTPDGTRLQDGSSRFLLCDPRLRPVVTNTLGVPLDMGRNARFATPQQRRAMAVRDGGCVWPGCTCPSSWTDAHHNDEWGAQVGATDVARMSSLCRYHHMVVHRTGWEMFAEPDGTFWFRTPAGRTFWGQQRGRQVRGPTPDSS